MWKYNKEKHSVYEFDLPNASHEIIPVQGKFDWLDGEDVTGKFKEQHQIFQGKYSIPFWQDVSDEDYDSETRQQKRIVAIPINIQEQPQVSDKDIELPDILIKYLTESFKEAAEVYGKIKRTSSYGGSAFVIFEDDKCYRLNFQSYNDEVSMDKAALNKQGSDAWVSVEDKLPEINQHVILEIGCKIPALGCYKGDNKFLDHSLNEIWDIQEDEIEYWMPLPAPPSKTVQSQQEQPK